MSDRLSSAWGLLPPTHFDGGDRGISAVALGDAIRRALDGVDRWADVAWRNAGEWPERARLWRDRRPAHIPDDPTDFVACRLLEGAYAKWRPWQAPLSIRPADAPDWTASPSDCLRKLAPWFKALVRAPQPMPVPNGVIDVLDAIKFGGNWKVRPGTFNESWDAVVQTVGGVRFDLTFWMEPENATPQPHCGLLDARSHRHDIPLHQAEQTLPAVRDAGEKLIWVGYYSFGPAIMDIAAGRYRVRVRRQSECAPSGASALLVRDRRRRAESSSSKDSYDDDDGPRSGDWGDDDPPDDNYNFGDG